MLTTITPATTRDLVTLASVKAQLGIATKDEDVNLSAWVSQASAAVEAYCGCVYSRETVRQTDRTRGYTGEGIILERKYAPTIASVTEDGVTLTADQYELDGHVIYRLSSDERSSWTGKVVTEYSAGFSLTDMPANVQRAVILTVGQYRIGTTRDPQIRSESGDGLGSTSYFDGLDEYGLAPEARGLLTRIPEIW